MPSANVSCTSFRSRRTSPASSPSSTIPPPPLSSRRARSDVLNQRCRRARLSARACRPLHGGTRQRRADRPGARCADRQARRGAALDRGFAPRRSTAASTTRSPISAGGSVSPTARRKIRSAARFAEAAHWSREHCGALIEALTASENRTDRSARSGLQAILRAGDPVVEAHGRIDFFLNEDTDAGGWKCRSAPHRFGSAFHKDSPRPRGTDFEAEANRLLALAGRLVVARAYDATAALLTVGDAILQAYHLAKRRAGALDFSDLIAKARNLLSRADAAQWVLYKLDRRVEHILVDEAQDTSPDQWQVVQAIAEDFFAGEGIARAPRTIFAVGDDKQSIFGFQGAEPRMLVEMQRFFERKIEEAKHAFVARPLSLSFRSTREVLDAVDTVFGKRPRGKDHGLELRGPFVSPLRCARPRRASAAHSAAEDGGAGGLDRALRCAERGGNRARRTDRRRDRCGCAARRFPPASAFATARSSSSSASATLSPRR